jgi:hypothetical protein
MAKKVTTFPELAKPTRIMVDEDRLYIVEFPHVFIYSLADFKIIKKIGRRGEGPQEFLPAINLLPYPDHIIINSLGKITYWTKAGDFIKEVKCPFAGGVEPCEDVFVGFGNKRGTKEKPIDYQTIDVYDKDFNKLREIDRKPQDFQSNRNRGLTFYSQQYYFYIMNNEQIVITGHDGFVLNVFSKDGEKLYTIQRDYIKKKVTEADKAEVHHYFKTHPRLGPVYEANKHLLKFAEYFPAIQGFQPFTDRLYVYTYNKMDGLTETFIYDDNGNLFKKVYLPIIKRDVRSNLPFTIYRDKFYGLVENEEEEVWELHITEIK